MTSARFTLLAALAASTAGFLVHNRLEFPGMPLTSPENAGPLIVILLLAAATAAWPTRRGVHVALLAWGLLHLVVGAVLSVIPLPVWPFTPEQSLPHYAAHAAYGLLQVPLVIASGRRARTRDGAATQAPTRT